MSDLTIREIFPKKLMYYMSENNKTRNDIVRDLGFKYSTIRDWEKGLTVPRMDKVELLANYFHCTTADLLQETEKPIAADDGLSENKRILMDLVKDVPDEKAGMILRVLQSMLEAD